MLLVQESHNVLLITIPVAHDFLQLAFHPGLDFFTTTRRRVQQRILAILSHFLDELPDSGFGSVVQGVLLDGWENEWFHVAEQGNQTIFINLAPFRFGQINQLGSFITRESQIALHEVNQNILSHRPIVQVGNLQAVIEGLERPLANPQVVVILLESLVLSLDWSNTDDVDGREVKIFRLPFTGIVNLGLDKGGPVNRHDYTYTFYCVKAMCHFSRMTL